MLLCWTSTKTPIAAANTVAPINSARAIADEAWALPRVASSVTPAMTKMICVAAPAVMSTTVLAAACAAGTPHWCTSRAPTKSPPTPATGNRELMDSRSSASEQS